MDGNPLFGAPQGYAASASEAFRTVSEEVFSEVHMRVKLPSWATAVLAERGGFEPPTPG
jgi:hypothetical protein